MNTDALHPETARRAAIIANADPGAESAGRLLIVEDGDANHFAALDDRGRWLFALLHNGEAMPARQIANMRRLVACWNACEGLETQTLEALAGGTIAAELGRLEGIARAVTVEAAADVGALVVVNVHGGEVQDVRANIPARVLVLDADTHGATLGVAEIEGGRRYVTDWPVSAESAAANADGLAAVARIADALF